MKRLLLTLLLLVGLTAAASADTRLVLHYNTVQASEADTALSDLSGGGYDGMLMDGAAITTFKKEVVLKNGMKGWVDLGERFGDVVGGLTDFTVSARLYISTVNKYDRPGYVLLSFTQGDNISLSDKGYLYIGAADAGIHLSSSTVADEQSVATSKGLPTGSWHTFTWTVRGGVVRYYVDGTYQAGGRISLTPEQLGRTLRNRLFSTVNDGEARLASTYLSDFRIYDGALTTAEVCALAGKEYAEHYAHFICDYTFDPQSAPPGASLHGSARLTEVSGEYILDLGGDDGWYDLGTYVGETLHVTDDFTITTDLFIPTTTNLSQAGNFVWSFSCSDDIHTTPTGCFFLGAGQTRYAITPTNYHEEQVVQTGTPLAQGVWQNVAYRQHDGLGTLFINGLPVRSDSIRLTPKGLGKTEYNWLGRSCYAGDAYLSGARYHHLQIFYGALTDERILDACADLDKLNSELFAAQLEAAKERLTLASDILYDDIALPVNMDDGITVAWSSSDTEHLSSTGKVTRPALGEDTARVTLTATLTKKSLTARKTFLVRIVPVLDNAESVRTDLRMLVAEFERRNAAADLDCLRTDLSLPTLLSEGSYVRWRSSDPALVSHAGFLRGYSPKGNKTVSLTALVVKGSEADSVRFDVTVPEAPKYSAYLFAYFTGNSQSQEQIRLALSTDGFNYTPLNNGAPIISSDTIALKKAVRDPHILRGEDGRFYMVVTDMKSSEGWSSNDGLVLLRSDDLIHWTHSAIDFPTTWPERFDRQALTQVWAPQTIYDPETKQYMVYYSIGEKGQHYIIYYSYANADFTALTEPQVLYDHGANTIDADIVRSDDGTYHMFFKTEGQGNGIQQATATSLHGPWTAERRYLQQTDVAVEGSGVFRLIDSDEWVLMYDCYTSGYYQFCTSSNLHDFTFVCNTQTTGS
ncbi:MAG: family 43 glycosylhydrolase, partial [Bacteroidaceae bacterium]|nr:family 43 glycosylhydrolase [Bacteroidaceae bacterium]